MTKNFHRNNLLAIRWLVKPAKMKLSRVLLAEIFFTFAKSFAKGLTIVGKVCVTADFAKLTAKGFKSLLVHLEFLRKCQHVIVSAWYLIYDFMTGLSSLFVMFLSLGNKKGTRRLLFFLICHSQYH